VGELAAFLGIAILVIVTPGQDTALTVRNALLAGRRGGVRPRSASRPDKRAGRRRRASAWRRCSLLRSRSSSRSSLQAPPTSSTSSLTLAWLAAYSVAVAHAGDVLRRPGVRRSLDAITGTLLVGFGIRLAAER